MAPPMISEGSRPSRRVRGGLEYAAGHAADGRRRQQEPVTADPHVQYLGGQQHQDGLAHLVGEVVHAEQDSDHAQQPVPGQPAQALGDLGADGRPDVTGGLAAPGQGGHERRRGGERGGVQAERQGGGRGEQQAAGRRAEERLPHSEADLLAAVGPGQQFGRDQGGEHRLGGVAEDDLGAAEQQPGRAEDRDVRLAEDDQDGHRGDHGGLHGLSPPHERGPVVAVDDGAGRQREHYPGQVGRRGHDRDQPRVPGDRRGEQRQRGHQRAVAGAADRVGPPHAPVVAAQPGPAGRGTRRGLRHGGQAGFGHRGTATFK